jgi:hypothetical protein
MRKRDHKIPGFAEGEPARRFLDEHEGMKVRPETEIHVKLGHRYEV